jgi:2-dehydropantoate 2-reductase
MQHAILGPGGVGGLIGGALARAGHPVTLVVRPETLATYPRHLKVESAALGTFEASVRPVAALDGPVDVLWVTVKATHLDAALRQAPPERLGDGLVIPLLNGVDHVQRLRAEYGPDRVVAGAIRSDTERVAPGHIVHRVWHARVPADGAALSPTAVHPVELAANEAVRARVEAVAAELTAAGVPCAVRVDEAQVLWSKLVGLASGGLAAAAAGSAAAARADPELYALTVEALKAVVAVAATQGARLNEEQLLAALARPPGDNKSSMQRDLEAGRPIELDALAGPVIREGRTHDIDVSAVEALRERVAARARSGQRA